MRARKCDRCGKLYEHYDGIKLVDEKKKGNGLILINRDLDNYHWSRNVYDLCPECMDWLVSFLSGKQMTKRLEEERTAG